MLGEVKLPTFFKLICMSNFNKLKSNRLYLLLVSLFISLTALGQTVNPTNEPAISKIVGDALPSTGMAQSVPKLSSISVVAPDVLCIEIDACSLYRKW